MFLNAFMPVVPWLLLVAVLSGLASWAAVHWVQLCVARKHQIEEPVRALQQARDVLAAVISSNVFFGGDARDKALSAYQSVTDALNKEKKN